MDAIKYLAKVQGLIGVEPPLFNVYTAQKPKTLPRRDERLHQTVLTTENS